MVFVSLTKYFDPVHLPKQKHNDPHLVKNSPKNGNKTGKNGPKTK